jgi:cytochrome c556
MKKSVAATIGVLTLAAGLGADAQTKPEDSIKYRRAAMLLVGANFGPLAAMAQGKRPYDKEAAIKHANIVAIVGKLPLEGFVPGTDTGETKAKPEIWQDMDDFKAKMDKMNQETAKLAQVAQSGDFDALKAQVGETGKACKACHDKYRNK